jgi:RimJ/RimL family protein N-acetyltransferase
MLETERLLIRRVTPDDLDVLVTLRSGDDVNRYIGGRELQNPEAIEKRLQVYMDCWDKFGFGMGLMMYKPTGEPIGWSGLMPLEDTGEIEVGYGMIKPYWRKGIGLECARAWLDYGFNQAHLERIVAVAAPENTGSWRIMEKLGMKYEKTEKHYGMPCVFYAISKEEFAALASPPALL